MKIEQKLKIYILSKYKSIRQFVETTDLPYTTVDGILKRGIENSSVKNVINELRKLKLKDYTPQIDDLDTTDKEIDKISKQINKLISLYSMDGIPLDLLQRQIDDLNNKKPSFLRGRKKKLYMKLRQSSVLLMISYIKVLLKIS